MGKLDKRNDSMHDGKSITDELRDFAKRWPCTDYVCKDMLAIADRIDAEHEAKVSYWQGASYKDGYDEGFASADDWLAQHEDAMAEHGWVRLPVDADGVPIRVGDVLTDDAEFKSEGKVIRLMLEDESWSVGLECGGWTNPSIHEWHHYHEPTVEDVLAEFFEEVGDGLHTINAVDTRVIIAKYAKRLTLAGDAE